MCEEAWSKRKTPEEEGVVDLYTGTVPLGTADARFAMEPISSSQRGRLARTASIDSDSDLGDPRGSRTRLAIRKTGPDVGPRPGTSEATLEPPPSKPPLDMGCGAACRCRPDLSGSPIWSLHLHAVVVRRAARRLVMRAARKVWGRMGVCGNLGRSGVLFHLMHVPSSSALGRHCLPSGRPRAAQSCLAPTRAALAAVLSNKVVGNAQRWLSIGVTASKQLP
ncbi:hypothetical protein QBC34DRAFT_122303 [Podospora aff. communis PSN243]|uniref:Uncharacterized protein n=1 Tax=Podospora aff. communis PSN243 TaxID=3040156 RepID=A0AAV9GMS1_9PEZI|nr:hypothetical protein QBC34DRAFT_122303 [Podospora aff. communis PSN243]